MSASERRALGPILSVIAGNVLFGTGLIFHAFLYNFYLEALHFSADVMGDAAAALAAGGLVTLLPAGAFTDRAGPRAAVATAAVVLATGLALGAVATTPFAVYAAAAVAGAGSGIWRVAMPPVLMGLTEPGTRARAFAWNVGMLVVWGGLGTAMAGATSEWLEGGWGFQHTAALRGALLLGAVGSAASLSVFRRLQMPAKGMLRTAPAAQSVPVGTSQQATRQMLLLVGLVAVWMLGPALAAPFFNIFFAREHGLSIERIGFILAAGNVCWALAVFASGEVARRVGVGRVLVVSLLFFAPAMWGLSFAGTVPVRLRRSHRRDYPKESLADSPPLDTEDLARRRERAVHPRPRDIGEEPEDVFQGRHPNEPLGGRVGVQALRRLGRHLTDQAAEPPRRCRHYLLEDAWIDGPRRQLLCQRQRGEHKPADPGAADEVAERAPLIGAAGQVTSPDEDELDQPDERHR